MAKYRILILDDLFEVRRMFAEWLKTLGRDFEVVEIRSAEEALLVASYQPVDLLVTDVRLPGMSGLELVGRIRKRNPNIKIILFTGLTEPDIRRRVAEANVDAFFYKPIEMADFLDAVERCLGVVKTMFPMEPVAEEPGLPSPPAPTLAERLSSLYQELKAIGVIFMDDQGYVLAQAGDLPDAPTESMLITSLLSALGASARVTPLMGLSTPENLLYFTGARYNLWLAPVGQTHALLIATDKAVQANRMAHISRGVFSAVRDLQGILATQGALVPFESPAAFEAPVEVEEEAGEIEDVPEIEDIFRKVSEEKLKPEEVNAFWDTVVEQSTPNGMTSADTITYDQARQLGLAPGEEKD
jgi:CheY-like chemotaxis protein